MPVKSSTRVIAGLRGRCKVLDRLIEREQDNLPRLRSAGSRSEAILEIHSLQDEKQRILDRLEGLLVEGGKMKKVFDQQGDFEACRAAEAWCRENGYSVGTMQGRDPRGILLGDYDIAKWRNLDKMHRAALHGVMTGSMRNGPVTVEIYETAKVPA